MTAANNDQPDRTPHNVNFLILGGASDLARRLLIPGIAAYLAEYPEADTAIRIHGVGRSEVDRYPQLVHDALADTGREVPAAVVDHLVEGARYTVADATDPGDLSSLLNDSDSATTTIVYFALAPTVTGDAVEAIAEAGLPDQAVLVLEKPFGEDAASSDELNHKLLAVTDEDHIFRVDHFNFETALSNLTGLIGANALFAAGWDNRSVESVKICYEESLALEGRAEFFDANGAVRDMLQSHLLQVMAHALATGANDHPTDILAATTIDPESVRRARYTAGEIDGKHIPDYTEEDGVDPERDTETLFQVVAQVDTDRWRGVPVTLRSGKAIADPRQEIRINYRRRGHADELELNPGTVLSFPFSDEVALAVNVSDHGYHKNLQRVSLETELVPSHLSAYGRVVRAIIRGDHAREVAAAAPAQSWEIVEPVLAAFASGAAPLDEYPAGSQGPEGW